MVHEKLGYFTRRKLYNLMKPKQRVVVNKQYRLLKELKTELTDIIEKNKDTHVFWRWIRKFDQEPILQGKVIYFGPVVDICVLNINIPAYELLQGNKPYISVDHLGYIFLAEKLKNKSLSIAHNYGY